MTDRDYSLPEDLFVWFGVLDPSYMFDHAVSVGHRFADAAKVGDWSTVLNMLDDPSQQARINWWRPGGTAWFTVLHQAAWHGAPAGVADELIRRGALRSLTDSRGRTAYDVRCKRDTQANSPKGVAAQRRKSLVLRERCLKPPPSPLRQSDISVLAKHLAGVIDSRIKGMDGYGSDPQRVLRYPPVGIMHEVPGQELWFPVGGMYGGFHIKLMGDCLEVRSWCRIFGGSGQAHLVTREGAILVDEGFC